MLDPKIKSKEIFFKELQKRFPDNHIEILDYIKASGPITYQCLDCGTIYKKVEQITYMKIKLFARNVLLEEQAYYDRHF